MEQKYKGMDFHIFKTKEKDVAGINRRIIWK